MKNKTQYSKFYGKLIDLAAMKLTSSLWYFLVAVFYKYFSSIYTHTLTDNKPREVRRQQWSIERER